MPDLPLKPVPSEDWQREFDRLVTLLSRTIMIPIAVRPNSINRGTAYVVLSSKDPRRFPSLAPSNRCNLRKSQFGSSVEVSTPQGDTRWRERTPG